MYVTKKKKTEAMWKEGGCIGEARHGDESRITEEQELLRLAEN
jgi:hypothetical protein